MTYFVEIRATVRRVGRPKLVPLADVGNYRGFRSAFAFDRETVEDITEAGSTAGLARRAVFADTLFMDFDGHDPADFRAWLAGSGLAHEEWHSGGRSIHFHVALEPVFDAWVPAACKAWVKERAPTADVSFYHPAGMYRLPGTYHAKYPGKYKKLLNSCPGRRLALGAASAPVRAPVPRSANEAEFYLLLTQRVRQGRRRPHLWLLATTGLELGMPFDVVLEHAHWWNREFCDPPHAEHVVQQQCESAHRRLVSCK